jgi:hypothetical protein
MPLKSTLIDPFCRCIKKVRKNIKLKSRKSKSIKNKEGIAIAICVKSVLQTKNKTLKKFRCTPKNKAYLLTQNLLKNI